MKNRVMHPNGQIEDMDRGRMFCHVVLYEEELKDWNDMGSFPSYLPNSTCYPKPDEGPCAHGYEVRTPKFLAVYDTELPNIWLHNQRVIDEMAEEDARRLNLRQTNAKPRLPPGWEPAPNPESRIRNGVPHCYHCNSTNFGLDGPCKDCGKPPFLRRKS